MGGGFSILGPSLPYLARNTGLSLDQVSDLFLIMPLGFILGIFLFRQFFNKDWLRVMFFLGIVAHIFFLPLIPLTEIFFPVMLMLFVISVGRGIINLSSNVFLLELHKTRPGPYLNGFHFCFGMGATLAPIMVGYELDNSNTIFISYLIFGLINIPLLAFILKFKISAVPPEPATTIPRKSMLKILAMIYIYLFCYVTVEAGYGTWIFSYMSESEGGIMSASTAGIFTSVYWLAFTVGRLAGVVLSIYFHPVNILLTHAFLSVLALVMIILASHNLWVMWIANVLLGSGLAVMFPTMIYYSNQAFNIPPKSMGNYFIAALAGAMAGPWALGQIFVVGRDLIFYPMLLACAIIPIIILAIRHIEKLKNHTL